MKLPNGSFQVDGVPIPTPTQYNYGEEDVSSEETGRDMAATMHKDIIAVKEYYECSWDRLTWQEAATLMNAIRGKSQMSFTHLDPKVPFEWVTGNFYVGKRNTAALNLSEAGKWEDFKITFTQI